MLKLYFHSTDITVDHKRKKIQSIAIYDINLLPDFLGNLMFTGSPSKLVEANKVMERFLSLLHPDSTCIGVENDVMGIKMYYTDFIKDDEVDWSLGEKPEAPFYEILSSVQLLSSAMNYGSPNAAAEYSKLQTLFEKYPELPRK